MEMDKTQWQWLLAGFGILVVVLIYLWGIRSSLKEKIGKPRRRPEQEPVFSDSLNAPDPLLNSHDFGDLGRITPDHHLADKALVDVEVRPVEPRNGLSSINDDPQATLSRQESQTPAKTGETADSAAATLTVILTVLAPRGQSFEGLHIQSVAEAQDLRLEADGLFKRFLERNGAAAPVFSMAHLREPGVFNPQTMAALSTPGLLLFMPLPGPLEGMEALDLLVITADHLARNLGGIISDERHNRLTNAMLQRLRAQVTAWEARPPAQSD